MGLSAGLLVATACRTSSPPNPAKAKQSTPQAAAPKREAPPRSPSPTPTDKLAWSAAEIVAGRDPGPLPEDEILWRDDFEGQNALEVRFSQPYMAAADAKGRVYIVDKNAHALRRVDELGDITTVAGTGAPGNGRDSVQPGRDCALSHPNGLWVDPDGTAFILDRDNAKVRRLDPDGTIRTITSVAGGLKTGRGLWLSPDHKDIWISAGDRLIHAQPPKKPKVLADGFISLANLALSPEGSIIAADRGANLIYSISPKGEKTVIAGNGNSASSGQDAPARKQGLNGPRAVVVLQDGSILIATQRGQRIWRWHRGQAGKSGKADKPGKAQPAQLQLWFDAKKPHRAQPLKSPHPIAAIRGLSQSPKGDLLLTHGDAGQVIRFTRK